MMNAIEVKRQAEADGIRLILDGEKLKVRGESEVITKWLPVIRKHKASILAILTGNGFPKKSAANPNFILGFACPCGSIAYRPGTFKWHGTKGIRNWGFSCLNCETRYWFV